MSDARQKHRCSIALEPDDVDELEDLLTLVVDDARGWERTIRRAERFRAKLREAMANPDPTPKPREYPGVHCPACRVRLRPELRDDATPGVPGTHCRTCGSVLLTAARVRGELKRVRAESAEEDRP